MLIEVHFLTIIFMNQYLFSFVCFRRVLGNFNILTVSAMPAFLSSVFSIFIERPSRRVLLCLYVSNIATETVWNMARSRNIVHNVKYGDIAIYSLSMAVLLTFFKGGYHGGSENKVDAVFRVIRFVESLIVVNL